MFAQIDVRNETINTSLLKQSNKHVTLLSDANVPVRFRAQQRSKYTLPQLTAICIAAIRCVRYYVQLICESSTTGDTIFHRRSFHSKFESNDLCVDRNRKVSGRFFQFLQFSRQYPSFSPYKAAMMTSLLDFACIFLKFCRFRCSILLSLKFDSFFRSVAFPGLITTICYA